MAKVTCTQIRSEPDDPDNEVNVHNTSDGEEQKSEATSPKLDVREPYEASVHALPASSDAETDEVKLAVQAAANLPADFTEWEAVRLHLRPQCSLLC